MRLLDHVDAPLAGLVLALGVLGAVALRPRPPGERAGRRLARVAFATYGGLTLVLGLTGGTPGRRALNLVPLRTVVEEAGNPDLGLLLVNLVGNVVFFVPLGAFLLATTRLRPVRAAATGTACCVALEVVQYGVGRTADVDDVLLNAVGVALGVVGVVVARHGRRRPPQGPRGRWPAEVPATGGRGGQVTSSTTTP